MLSCYPWGALVLNVRQGKWKEIPLSSQAEGEGTDYSVPGLDHSGAMAGPGCAGRMSMVSMALPRSELGTSLPSGGPSYLLWVHGTLEG